ncbi:MAG: hypothetical protein IPL99_25705 [Candidatus Competibacteraceae bacterium]|nr:hypothetical protein [Candidatus Competibacteraceae bacterium]
MTRQKMGRIDSVSGGWPWLALIGAWAVGPVVRRGALPDRVDRRRPPAVGGLG